MNEIRAARPEKAVSDLPPKEQVIIMRKRYMDHVYGHTQYYLWLADLIECTADMVPYSTERLIKSKDPHLNDLPLKLWDRQDSSVRRLAYRKGLAWSLSDTVCVLKSLARKVIAENTPFDGVDHTHDGERIHGDKCLCGSTLRDNTHQAKSPYGEDITVGEKVCWNCGIRTDQHGDIIRGRSIPCPNRVHHHIGSTCSICGLVD